jgi:hypothetical protein
MVFSMQIAQEKLSNCFPVASDPLRFVKASRNHVQNHDCKAPTIAVGGGYKCASESPVKIDKETISFED